MAGCMEVVGFRARDTDQITNKWDGLIKDYKKLKEYIEGTGSGNWWAMSREEKKQLSKTRKMSLEFSEQMYTEMEGFIGRRHILGVHLTGWIQTVLPRPCLGTLDVPLPLHVHMAIRGLGIPLQVPRPHPSLQLAGHPATTLRDQLGVRGKRLGQKIRWTL